MTTDSEIVSILLLAFDKLRELILNYRDSNSADVGEFTAALSRLTEEHLSPEKKSSADEVTRIAVPDTVRTISGSRFDLDQARASGKTVYVIEYDLIHDIQQRGKTPLAVFKDLMKCGTILNTGCDFDAVGTLEGEPAHRLPLDVLYATVLDNYFLTQTLELRQEMVHRIPAPEVKIEQPSAPKAHAEPISAERERTESVKDEVEGPLARPGSKPAQTTQQEATVRLNVALLDDLMTLAGELVLGRNQLSEAVRKDDLQEVRASAHRVSLVTSELQQAVSLTRMQPVAGLFSKFPRLVRDLAADLGKEVQLKLEGGEVELDKTILEGLSDPLTHMVRNSVDHGIEERSARIAAGKAAAGTVTLRALHRAGQVEIEISDDGKGLDGEKIGNSAVKKGMISAEQLRGMSEAEKQALIFLPGVSTAEKLSNISGRGVGMDVVKTNLDKLGGKVEIDSVPGKGSAFRIKLPLTLAIIPSLLVSESGERFAIPQISVGELIRIPTSQVAKRIEKAGDSDVVVVRERLVPLIYLSEVLGGIRPDQSERALNIVLVDTGNFEYGLVVGELHDTVEIVVKPMGRHLQSLHEYAGATILGDGQVAVILDAAGLAARAGLTRAGNATRTHQVVQEEVAGEAQSLLLFENAPGERCAVPIELVTRVERVKFNQVESIGGRRTMQYCGASLPLITLHDLAHVDELEQVQEWVVIVFERAGFPVGLLAAEPLDMLETRLSLDTVTLRQPGVAGSLLLRGQTTLMLDLFELTATVPGSSPEHAIRGSSIVTPQQSGTVLVAEDSDFFRGQITRLIEAVGYKVLAAEDGQAAWEMLDRHAGEISVVTTDVEMPRLDGLGLTRRIRADERFENLPVIALSTLAGEEEMARGLAMGINEYQVKLDQGLLLASIRKAVGNSDRHSPAVTA